MAWLTDLADVCRQAGLLVREDPGWQHRGRGNGSSYAPGRPTHVMVHHTASPASSDGRRDVDYICRGSDVAPVANLYLDRAGVVWVCAGGPTNTNGKGSSRPWSGGVPDDLMNVYAIGVEAANTGTGETWPPAQCDAYVILCAALCSQYGIPVAHVRAHAEWATPSGRKIDPAGPSPWALRGTWDMDAFRADVHERMTGGSRPPTPTPTKGADMLILDLNPGTGWWVAMMLAGDEITHLVNGHHVAVMERGGVPRVKLDETELSGVLLSVTATNPSPFAPGMPAHNDTLHAGWNAALARK